MGKLKNPKIKKKSQGDSGGENAHAAPPPLAGSGAGHKASLFERMVQRVKGWFVYFPDDVSDEPINKTHDLSSQRLAGRVSRQEPGGSPFNRQNEPELTSSSVQDADTLPDASEFAALFKRSIRDLYIKIEGLDRRLSLLEDKEGLPDSGLGSTSPKTGVTDWRNGSDEIHETKVRYNPREKQQTARERHASATKSGNSIDAIEQAICSVLDQGPQGSFDLETLVQEVEASLSCKLEEEFLGPHFRNEWRMAILWLGGTTEGLVLVSPGELVDSEITQYFEVEFGRRILYCRQPARVVRRGGQVDVLRKGLVDNS